MTGSDPDGLMRSQGGEAFRGRIQRARHWWDWELEQVLAPLQVAPDDLAVLQRCERQASLLLAALPPGALRHRAEQRLKEGLGALPIRHSAPLPAKEPGTPADLRSYWLAPRASVTQRQQMPQRSRPRRLQRASGPSDELCGCLSAIPRARR